MNIVEWGIGTAIFATLFIGGLYGYDKLTEDSRTKEETTILENSRNRGGFRKTRKTKNKRL